MILKKKYIVGLTPTQSIPLGFVLIIIMGVILLNLPIASKNGESIGFINALFTSTSAVCVTGLVVVDTYSHWTTFGQLVILLLIQIGGLGFMAIATLVSLILRRKITLKERLLIAESFNQYNLEGVVRLTKQILLGTLIFEGAGAIILSIRFISDFGIIDGIYKGVFHSISAFCNAGFDLMGGTHQLGSFTSYVNDTVINITIISLIVIGGLGFSVWSDIYKSKKFSELRLQTKLVLIITAILIIGGALFFFLMEFNNAGTMQELSLKGKILASTFQSVSPRTAGINTIVLSELTNASKFITIILMFIGGSPGSTAGGIKTTTIGVLIFAIISIFKSTEDVEILKKRISFNIVLKALAIALIALGIVIITTIVLTICEPTTFMEALFEAVSAFGTVGLSLGITPSLSSISKIVLIIAMYSGRVGVLTLGLALSIKMNKKNVKYKYPEDKVIVG